MNRELKKQPLFVTGFSGWAESVPKLLNAAGFAFVVPNDRPVLLKPNLVNAEKPPITTPVELVAEIAGYLREHRPEVTIIVGEGCGSNTYDTDKCFHDLGYEEMAKKLGVELIDLNYAEPFRKMSNPKCGRWPEMYLPEIVMESFLVSVPVLKAHSLADVTLTMKNMIGTAPPKYYDAGSWKKSAFHSGMQEAVLDLNLYRTPDYTILDATIGMQEAHLWGRHCSPPHNLLAACADPVAIDVWGTNLLGFDWQEIAHIADTDGILGFSEPEKIVNV